MKMKPLSLALASLLALRTATHAQSVSTRSGRLDFELGVPTKETVTKLYADGLRALIGPSLGEKHQ